MTDIAHERRLAILDNPTETLRIECKSWLDLTDNHHKAVIAKAAIALANSGGGIIAFGITEDKSAGGRLTLVPRPAEISRYTTDAIGAAINKYADPDIDFDLAFERHPDTGEEHAFIEIPGAMLQPVFSKKSYDGVIKKFAAYIRKPGPKSEEPHTVQEWRDLMTRCVRANQDSMLDSIRTIMDGRPLDTAPTPADEENIVEFMRESKERWQERLQDVDEDDVARLEHGYWACAFSIVGGDAWTTLNDVRGALDEARPERLRHRLFADVGGKDRSPYPAEGSVEAWPGNHAADLLYRKPYDCAFWRATPRGEFFHLEGFFEDSLNRRYEEPGTRFFFDLSISIHAMMFMLAARFAKMKGDEARVVICSELTGLSGRFLTDRFQRELTVYDRWQCTVDAITISPARYTWREIESNLPEILHGFLYPVFEKFAFYELNRAHVTTAVEELRREGW